MAQTWELSYLLTDHLGSVVAVTDSSGALISQQRYLPFGGVRTVPNSPITNTDYGYTGQRNLDEDIGLMDYKARFYSPVLNRFIQPDTIVPNPMNPQAYNRFSYVLNSPINFNDPTGHIGCDENVRTGKCIDNIPSTGNYLGDTYDERGVYFATLYVSQSDAVVAAGIAVQSQWFDEEWDNPDNWWSLASSFGLAQATDDELDGRDPMNPYVAVDVMEERIENAVLLCIKKKLCQDETDNLIVAAIAQNGAHPNGWLHIPSLPQSSDGSVDWEIVMLEQGGNTGNPIAKDRQEQSGMNFSTQFMLKLFISDLEVLMDYGYTLSDKYDHADFKSINLLINMR